MIEVVEKVWAALSPFQSQIIAFALTLAAALLTYFFRAKVKLIYGFTNNSFHQLKTETGPVNVFCEKHYVQNIGKKPAENVEVVFSTRSFEKKNGPDGQLILAIPYLSPNELIIIDTIHVNSRTAELRAVHCPENSGKRVEFWVQRKLRRSHYIFWVIASLLGIFYAAQLLVSIVAALVKAAS